MDAAARARLDRYERLVMDFSFRSGILFVTGVVCSLVLLLLQTEQQFSSLPLMPAFLVAGCCGTAAVAIGLVYPCVDGCVGQRSFRIDWSSVMRCLVVFFGINEASVKIPFEDSRELTLTLAGMSLGLWWLFDRTGSGFGLGVSVALFATSAMPLFTFSGSLLESDYGLFAQTRTWLPCIFFSGGVTFGHLGRKLAEDLKKIA